MESNWRSCSLGDALTLQRGFDLPLAQRVNGPVPVIASTGQVGWHNRSAVTGPGVVIGRSGSLGGGQFIEGAYWPLNTTLWVKDFKGNDPRYCYYLLKSIDFRQFNVGSGVPTLNRNHVHPLPILLPPIDDQRRISGTLAAFDERIDNLRQTSAALEAIAQALFKSWFVDFDPVRAKAEGREPESIDAATAALFPSEFEDSELGSIPKGWHVRSFGSLLAHSIGGDWGNEVATDEQTERVAIIRGTDIPDLRSQSDCRVPIRFTTPRKVVGRALAVGDLVVEVSGGSKGQPTGRSLYVTSELLAQFDCSVVPASFCRKFSPVTEQIGLLLGQHMDFIYAAGKTWKYQNQSTGIANFQTKHFLANENVVVPSEEVLDAFYKLVGPMVERTQLLQARRLGDLRDTLLPRLISGKVRLPDAEREVEAATA